MADIAERNHPLHNFSFPNWGIRKGNRCVKTIPIQETSSTVRSSLPESNGPNLRLIPSSTSPSRLELQNPLSVARKEGGLKLLIHCRKPRAEKEELPGQLPSLDRKVDICADLEEQEGRGGGGELPQKKSWDLREKKSAPNAPTSAGNSSGRFPMPSENQLKSVRLKALAAAAREGGKEKKENLKFSISLSKEEIVADFLATTGSKPPRRPQKRPKIVQKALDATFPGLWLAEITADSYKIPDVDESTKR